jgi:cytochrome oxidase assembly protein ShyY1
VLRLAIQPRWWAWHLLLVAVLVSFGWLGGWQLGAYEDKGAHDAAPGARPPVALDTLSSPGGRLGDDDLGRRVTATGTYDPAGTRFVAGRDRPGGSRKGFWAVAMLRTSHGVLPVVRGWVPAHDGEAATAPAGRRTVTGLLQRSEDGPRGSGTGDVGPDRLPYVATVTVLDRLPYRPGELYDGYLALRSERPAPAARPEPVEAQDLTSGGVGRWRNLAYALQWWVFAGAAVFFWWIVLRRAAEEQRERSADGPPSTPPDAGPPSLVAPRRTT